MRTVALDVGSSSVKAALFDDDVRLGEIVRHPVVTRYEGQRVEIDAEPLWDAVVQAVRRLGPEARKADRIAFDALAPGFVAMTRDGAALTPVITHQDRRSAAQAAEIERRVGRDRHLSILGCRPFPGGIASSSLLWVRENQPEIYVKADIFGQLSTFLNLRLTGSAVLDPGNATFLGFYETFTLRGWSPELCEAMQVSPKRLPDVRFGNQVSGKLRPGPAEAMGLPSGIEVLTGVIDTTAAILSTGAAVGRLFNTIGTTDVLAIVTDKPKPGLKVLTRAFGVGRLWATVNTIAAGGGALTWAHQNLFADLAVPQFYELVRKLAADPTPSPVMFRPYLAGDRLSLEPKTAAFSKLTLATGRNDMLKAVLDAWADLNARGLQRLSKRARPLPDVYVSGGGGDGVSAILHSRWPGKWKFHYIQEAGLAGLAKLAMMGE